MTNISLFSESCDDIGDESIEEQEVEDDGEEGHKLYDEKLNTTFYVFFIFFTTQANGMSIKSRGNSYSNTIINTAGEKYLAAITVVTDIFINHFANDQAILLGLLLPKHIHHTICSTHDRINNHHTIASNFQSHILRKRSALYATGQAIISHISTIENRSICGCSALARGRI